MTTPLLDAFDLVAHAEVLELRLAATVTELSQREGLTAEKQWLTAAHRHLAHAREGVGKLLVRVLRLAELEPARAERARAIQGTAVDAVEGLQASIVTHVGDRSPVLEALFRNLKPPAMRRAGAEEFESFCSEVEKRLASSYVKRMLADASYAPVEPAVRDVRVAFADWRSVFASGPLADAEADVLRVELEAAARRVELPLRQARLLAEAALLADRELAERSGILDKPRLRRSVRTSKVDAETGRNDDSGPAQPDVAHDAHEA